MRRKLKSKPKKLPNPPQWQAVRPPGADEAFDAIAKIDEAIKAISAGLNKDQTLPSLYLARCRIEEARMWLINAAKSEVIPMTFRIVMDDRRKGKSKLAKAT